MENHNATRRSLLLTGVGLAVLAPTAASALIARPDEPGMPTATDLSGLVGKKLRVVHPGEMVTMDFSPDRITIEVDADDKIIRASIG